MAAGSLVVRISADINDFSRSLNKMTREVQHAADAVAEVGKKMTLAITLPVGLAALALSKLALDSDLVAAKFDRSMGPAVGRMNGLIGQLMKVVPETHVEMQKFAVLSNDFARG